MRKPRVARSFFKHLSASFPAKVGKFCLVESLSEDALLFSARAYVAHIRRKDSLVLFLGCEELAGGLLRFYFGDDGLCDTFTAEMLVNAMFTHESHEPAPDKISIYVCEHEDLTEHMGCRIVSRGEAFTLYGAGSDDAGPPGPAPVADCPNEFAQGFADLPGAADERPIVALAGDSPSESSEDESTESNDTTSSSTASSTSYSDSDLFAEAQDVEAVAPDLAPVEPLQETAQDLDFYFNPKHHFLWLTRTARPATCFHCKKQIPSWSFRMLFHPDASNLSIPERRQWRNVWWHYFHIEPMCLEGAAPHVKLLMLENLSVDIAIKPARHKESDENRRRATEEAKLIIERFFSVAPGVQHSQRRNKQCVFFGRSKQCGSFGRVNCKF